MHHGHTHKYTEKERESERAMEKKRFNGKCDTIRNYHSYIQEFRKWRDRENVRYADMRNGKFETQKKAPGVRMLFGGVINVYVLACDCGFVWLFKFLSDSTKETAAIGGAVEDA